MNPDVSYYRHLGGYWYWEILISIRNGICPIHHAPLHPSGPGYCHQCRAYWHWDPENQSVHRSTTPP